MHHSDSTKMTDKFDKEVSISLSAPKDDIKFEIW